MNKTYRVVYNETTQTYTAVAEIATAHGKSSSGTVTADAPVTTRSRKALMLSVLALGMFASGEAAAAIFDTSEGSNNILIGRESGNSAKKLDNTNVIHSVIIGTNAKGNAGSAALGDRALATGSQSVSLGANTTASGDSSVAIGGDDLNAIVDNDDPASISSTYTRLSGGDVIEKGSQDNPLGYFNSTASGGAAVAVGVQSVASGDLSTAFGTRTNAAGLGAAAFGVSAIAAGEGSVASGVYARAVDNGAVALGTDAMAGSLDGNEVKKAYLTGYKEYVDQNVRDKRIENATKAQLAAAHQAGITAQNAYIQANGGGTAAENAVAIGKGAESKKANAIALGAGSTTDADATIVNTADINGVTYNDFQGGANVLAGDQVSVGSAGNERQIKHVAPGALTADSTDAVNGSQLYAVAAQLQAADTHYYSVNDGGTQGTNYDNTGATGTNALAAGVDTAATGISATAVGHSATAGGEGAFAGGLSASASANSTVALGRGATASVVGATAIGESATAKNKNTVAIGTNATASDEGAYAMGHGANASGHSSYAIGTNAQASDKNSLAFGNNGVAATAQNALALGHAAKAEDENTIAIGDGATAKASGEGQLDGRGATAIGKNAQALSMEATALGSGAVASGGTGSIALGRGTTASAEGASALGNTANASGWLSTAVGHAAAASTTGAVAVGKGAAASGSSAVAIGDISKSGNTYTVAVGYKADASGVQSVATGGESVASNLQSNAYGYKATASADSATALGAKTIASGVAATAVGVSALASESSTVAIGHNAQAKGTFDVAVGRNAMNNATSTGNGSNVAIGDGALKDATTTNNNSAIGTAAGQGIHGTQNVMFGAYANSITAAADAQLPGGKVTADNTVAVGGRALASSSSAVAVGSRTQATGSIATAIGASAKAKGNYAIAQGYAAEASGTSSIAIGAAQNLPNSTKAKGNYAIAIGYSTEAAENSTAIGKSNKVSGNNTVVLGNNITATAANNVILGHDSNESSATTPTDQAGQASKVTKATVGDITYGTFAGTASGIVSVGAQGKERQIINVAPGKISDDSTDAINGSQLFATNNVLSTLAKSVKTEFGDNAALNPTTGEITFSDIGGTGKDTIHEAIAAVKETVVAGTNIASVNAVPDQATGATTYTVNAKGTTASSADTSYVTVTDADKGGNVTDYAVDLSQTAKDSLGRADTAMQSFNVAVNGNVQKVSDGQTVNFVNGTGTTVSNGANGISYSVNKSALNTDAAGNVTAAAAGDRFATAEEVAKAVNEAAQRTEKTSSVVAGSNTHVQDNVNGNHTTYTVSADKTTVSVGSALKKTETPNTDNTTQAVTTNYAIDLADDTKENIKKGVDAKTKVDSDGLTFTGDKGSSTTEQLLGSTVAVKGDSNITTEATGSQINIKLNDDLNVGSVTAGSGANQVVLGNGGVSVGGKTYITAGGLDANNQTIGNVAAGKKANDAVNVLQLNTLADALGFQVDPNNGSVTTPTYTTGSGAQAQTSNSIQGALTNLSNRLDKPLTFAADKGADSPRTLGSTVKIKGGNHTGTASANNIVTESNGTDTITVKLADAPVFSGKLTAKGLDAGGQTITNVGDGTDANDAVNVGQLQDAINNIGITSLAVVEANSPFSYVNEAGDQLLREVDSNGDVSFKKVKKDAGGRTIIGPDGKIATEAYAGTDVLISALNATDPQTAVPTRVTNVAAGTKATDAVNVTQLGQLATALGGGAAVGNDGTLKKPEYTIKYANGGTMAPVNNVADALKNLNTALQQPLTVSGNANNGSSTIVSGGSDQVLGSHLQIKGGLADGAAASGSNVRTTVTNGLVKIELADAPTFAGKLTAEGLDAGGERISNVADGQKADDAVNFGQLTTTNQNVAQNTADIAANKTDIGNNAANIAKGINIGGTTGSRNYALGDTVNIKGDSNISSETVAGGVQLKLADSVTIGKANPVTVDGTAGTVTGLSNTAWNPASIASGRAATEDQLKAVSDTANAGWNLTAEGANGSKVAAGGTVDLNSADNNIVVSKAAGDNAVTFDLADNINVDSVKAGATTVNTAGVKNGDTALTKDGVKVGQGDKVKLTSDGLKVGNNTLTDTALTVDGQTVSNVNDAINQTAAQAFSPLTFAGDSGNNVTRRLGTTVNLKGGATGNLTDNNIAVVADGNDTLNIKLAEKINLGANGEIKAGNNVLNSDGLKAGPVSIDANGINAGDTVIKNVADGADAKDAVNFGQLEAAKAAATSKVESTDKSVNITDRKDQDQATVFDLSVNVDGTTITKDGDGKLKANTVKLADGNGDGKVDVPANGDEAKLATAGDIANAVNSIGWKAKSGGNKAAGDNAAEELVKAGDTVEFAAGKNLNVKRDGKTFTFETKDDVEFNNVTVGGQVKAGDTVLDNSGVKAGNDVALTSDGLKAGDVKVGKDGIDAGKKVIANVADGQNAKDAVNVSQLEKAKAAATTKVEAGENIEVTPSDNGDESKTYTVKLKRALDVDSVTAGDTVVNKDGVKVGQGDKVKLTSDGLTVGSNTLTDTALTVDGQTVSNVNDAINQTAAQAFSPLTFAGDSGNNVTRRLGTTVNLKGGATGNLTDNNIAVVADGNDTLNIKLAEKINLGANGEIKAGNNVLNSDGLKAGPVSIDANGINAGDTVIKNVADGADAKDAVNFGQLEAAKAAATSKVESTDKSVNITDRKDQDQATVFDLSVNVDGTTITKDGDGKLKANTVKLADGNGDGKVDVPANGDEAKLATAGDIANAVNSIGWKAKSGGNKAAGDNAAEELVKAGDTVEFAAGKNLNVKRDGKTFTFETKDDVEFNNVTVGGQVKAGDTVLDNSGVKAGNDVALTSDGLKAGDVKVGKDGIDAGKKVIANVADGQNAKDAVNVSQLEKAKAAATTKVEAGENIEVTPSDNGDESKTYTVKLKRALDVDSVTAGDTVVNKDGVKVGQGDKVKLTSDGLTVGSNTLTDTALTVDGQTVSNVNDAINQTAAQAFSPLTFAGDSGNNVTRRLGTTVNLKGGATGNLTDNNIAVVADGNDTLNIKLAEKINLGANGEIKAGNNVLNSDGLKAGPVSIDANGINAGDTVIKNVADGADAKDAVNFGQLEAAKAAATSKVESTDKSVNITDRKDQDQATVFDLSVNVDGTTITKDGDGKLKANTVKLADGNGDGKVDVPANGDEAKLATAGDIANAVNSIGWKAKSGGNKAAGDNAAEELVKAGDTVEFAAGKNLNVKRDGKTFTFETKDDVVFNDVTVNGQVKAGNDVALTSDGLKAGNVKVGKDGIDADGKTIANVADGQNAKDAVNVSQLEKAKAAATTKVVEGENVKVTPDTTNPDGSTTYTVAMKRDVNLDSVTAGDTVLNKDGIKVGQGDKVKLTSDGLTVGSNTLTDTALTVDGQTVSNVNDAINQTAAQAFSPLTFAGDQGGNVTRRLGTTVNLKGGATGNLTDNNIAVVADGNDTLTLKLAEKINLGADGEVKAGTTVLDNSGVKAGNDVALTSDGLKAGNVKVGKDGIDAGSKTIANVADGKAAKDAVNVSQLEAAKAAATSKVKSTDKSVTVTPDTDPKTKAPVFDLSVNVDGTTITKGTDGKLKANTTQLADTDGDGRIDVPANGNEAKLATAGDIANAVNSIGWKAKSGGNKAAGDNAAEELVKAGDTVEFAAGKNLNVKRDGKTFTFETKDDVEFNNVTVNGQVKAGTTVLDNSGVKAGNDVALTSDGLKAGDVKVGTTGIDAGKKVIANVADGEISATSKEAVNGSQLYQVYRVLGGNGDEIKSVQAPATQNADGTATPAGTVVTTVTNADGTTTTTTENNQTVAVSTDKGGNQYTLTTYNVEGQNTYVTNDVIQAIGKMNEQGIKFFHTNDGTVQPVVQGHNTEDSSASGAYATAIGYQSEAEGEGAVAMGNTYTTTGSDGNSVAQRTRATGKNAVAIGSGAQALADNTISIGTGNIVRGKNSGAIGDPSIIDGDNSYSVGNNNTLSTDNTFVLGNSVTQTMDNSVILGNQSSAAAVHTTAEGGHYTFAGANDANVAGVNDVVGVVSVGTEGQTRQVQNVAAGVVSPTSTDAVNGSQLHYTNEAINNVANYTVNMGNQLNQRIDSVEKRANAGAAAAMAVAGLPQAYLPGKSMVAIAGSAYRGESGYALGYSSISDNGNWVIKGSATGNSRGNYGATAGVGYQW